jgi:hypothetical protein
MLWKIKEIKVMMTENSTDIFRSSLDLADYRQPGMTLFNDSFEGNAEDMHII